MRRWIALLRGVNVGGSNRIAMAQLRDLLSSHGYEGVRTYIQSGNVVFDGPPDSVRETLATAISELIAATFGLTAPVYLTTLDDLESDIAANPFAAVAEDPRRVNFFFRFDEASAVDLDRLREVAVPGEEVVLTDRVLYHYSPDGIGRSKLAARIPKDVTGETTARNLRSVVAIRDLAIADR